MPSIIQRNSSSCYYLDFLDDCLRIAPGQTSEAIRKLIDLQARDARVIRNGQNRCSDSRVQIDDVEILVRQAKNSTDGVAIEGTSTIDESMVTGENVLVKKQPGDGMGDDPIETGGFGFRPHEWVRIRFSSNCSASPRFKANSAISRSSLSWFVPVVIAIAIFCYYLVDIMGNLTLALIYHRITDYRLSLLPGTLHPYICDGWYG